MPEITSKWSAVQDYLLDVVVDAMALTLPTVKVELSTPHPDDLLNAGVRVWLPMTDAEATHTQAYALSSLTAKEETWDQDIVVFGTVLTTDGADVRDRVDVAVHTILAAVSADPKFGGLVMLAQVIAVRREEATPDRAVRQHAATVKVRVRAWLDETSYLPT
jgi:hypothetical protein